MIYAKRTKRYVRVRYHGDDWHDIDPDRELVSGDAVMSVTVESPSPIAPLALDMVRHVVIVSPLLALYLSVVRRWYRTG